jgi:hypothetical protein
MPRQLVKNKIRKGLMTADLWLWKEASTYSKSEDWIFASPHTKGKYPFWPDVLLLKIIQPAARRAGIRKRVGWHIFDIRIRRSWLRTART